jgi:predicted acyl esterase
MLEALDGPCQWHKTDVWPPRGTDYVPHYLRPDGGLGDKPVGRETAVGTWTWNPLAGTGEAAFSKWDNAAGVPQREADQSTEDEWKGITFSTPVLTRDLSVHGPITLSLRAAIKPLPGADNGVNLDGLAAALGQPGVSQVFPPYLDSDLIVKLSDVSEDGTSTLIQTGFLRASHRRLDPKRTRRVGGRVVEPFHWDDAKHLAPPKDGVIHRYDIELFPTAKRFPKGHRLRIALYSADTPNHLTLLKPVQTTVFGGSYLLLPE